MLKFSVPLYVMMPRKTKKDKKFILNLNTYRNTHPMILSKAKNLYAEEVKKIFKATAKWCGYPYKTVEIEFVYYAASSRRVDKSNPLCIIEKFVCDALTDLGVWKDDDSAHIPVTIYKYGGVDRANPRCDVTINLIYENKGECRC